VTDIVSIKGIIFDMDGTITAPYFDFAKIKAAACIGERDLLDYLHEVDGAEYERIHNLMMEFEHDGMQNAKLNEGARDVLDYLTQKQIPTALLTRNSRRSVDGICEKLRLTFNITITREDAPYKPSPEPVWEIAQRWNAVPSDLLMVGDYKWDLMSAKNAGTPCAVLVNGSGVPEWAKDADLIFKQLVELIDHLESKHR